MEMDTKASGAFPALAVDRSVRVTAGLWAFPRALPNLFHSHDRAHRFIVQNLTLRAPK